MHPPSFYRGVPMPVYEDCEMCSGRGEYAGEPCVMCFGEHSHTPYDPSGWVAIYVTAAVITFVMVIIAISIWS